MTPALIWSAWTVRYGPNQPLPITLVFGPFVIVLFILAVNSVGSGIKPTCGTNSNPSPRIKIPSRGDTGAFTAASDQSKRRNLRNCFPGLFTTSTILSIALAVIYAGAVENHTGSSLANSGRNIEAQFGDRFLVVFQEGVNGKPFFALVPNLPVQRSTQPLTRPVLALGLLVATLLTTTVVGVEMLVLISRH